MIRLVIQNQSHRPFADLRRKLVRRSARHGSILFGSWSCQQTRRGSGAELHVPIHAEFHAVLDTIQHGHLIFIATVRGAARSEFAFTNWIIDAAKAAGLPPHRSPHGLRKAACVPLADAGCDVLEIMAITGHTDMKEVQTYVAVANKKKAAKSAITEAYGAA